MCSSLSEYQTLLQYTRKYFIYLHKESMAFPAINLLATDFFSFKF